MSSIRCVKIKIKAVDATVVDAQIQLHAIKKIRRNCLFFNAVNKYNKSMENKLYIDAKQIMYKIDHGQYWFGADYNMNLYKGCSHGCIYCDSRSECYRIENFDEVRMKKEVITLLHKELKGKKKKGVISIGAMSDTYNPLEKQYELTRKALQLIEQYGFGVSLETKSNLITRDIDLFKKIQKHHDCIVKMTITCVDDTLSSMIEPHVCPSSTRFNAIKEMSEQGLYVGILFTPMLPFITDSEEHIKEMVKKAYENKAHFIYSYQAVTLRDRQKEHYYTKLDQLFPGLSSKYRTIYRNHYMCNAINHKKLKKIFEQECKKYGLLYRMEDIIKAYKTYKEPTQLSLF